MNGDILTIIKIFFIFIVPAFLLQLGAAWLAMRFESMRARKQFQALADAHGWRMIDDRPRWGVAHLRIEGETQDRCPVKITVVPGSTSMVSMGNGIYGRVQMVATHIRVGDQEKKFPYYMTSKRSRRKVEVMLNEMMGQKQQRTRTDGRSE